jgi:hypothetical protein
MLGKQPHLVIKELLHSLYHEIPKLVTKGTGEGVLEIISRRGQSQIQVLEPGGGGERKKKLRKQNL